MIEQTSSSIDGQAVEYVTYRSYNRLLILHGDAFNVDLITHLSPHFQITSVVNEHLFKQLSLSFHSYNSVILKMREDFKLSGYLGNFRLTQHENGFDQVLDLQQNPAISSSIKPFGYLLKNKKGLSNIVAIVNELVDLIGVFDKPKYFYQLPERCAHSRRQLKGCSQCIEVCATDAITSTSESIFVDPYLCQGCGDCALVCPAGAINYQYPTREMVLQNIKKLIVENPGRILLLYCETDSPETDIPWPVNKFALEALGTIGMDVWLSSLAYGATQVWLYHEQTLTGESQAAIGGQIDYANSLLSGLGYPDQLIQLADSKQFKPTFAMDRLVPAVFAPVADKRKLIRMALDHFATQSQNADKFCPLPMQAGFGTINVITEDCTLCMACVSVCPEQALMAGTGMPQLKIVEAACVQCGICRQACPEQVITLEPRYLYDSLEASKPRLLHQQEPFYCIDCEQPFASRSMIDNILSKLDRHPMFQGEKRKQIQRCENCKIVAQFGK